jgi:D-mannonate dehydratase
MRSHHLAFGAVLATFVAAQDIVQNVIPQQCTAFCADVVSISSRCENTTGMHPDAPYLAKVGLTCLLHRHRYR